MFNRFEQQKAEHQLKKLAKYESYRVRAKQYRQELKNLVEDDDQLDLALYQKIISLIERIPVQRRTYRDHRRLAFAINNAATIRHDAHELFAYQNASQSLLRIPTHSFTFKDWRILALCYYNMAQSIAGNDEPQKTFYLAAIEALKHIPEYHFTDREWRDLARFEASLANIVEIDVGMNLYQSAIDHLMKFKNHFTADDWRNLSFYQKEMAVELDGDARLQGYRAAQASLSQINKQFFTSSDQYHWLVISKKIADFYFEIENYFQAKPMYASALQQLSAIFIFGHHNNISGFLAQIYQNLYDLTIAGSTENTIYGIAASLFRDHSYLQLKQDLKKIIAVTESGNSHEDMLAMIQILTFLLFDLQQPESRLPKISKLLKKPEELAFLETHLNILKNLYQPLKLFDAIDSSEQFSIAVAREIGALKERMSAQEKQIAQLQTENAQLKQRLNTPQVSTNVMSMFTNIRVEQSNDASECRLSNM